MNLDKFQKLIDANPEDETLLELMCASSLKQFKTKDLLSMPFSEFVDLERNLEELNFKEFCKGFVKNKFWQPIKVVNLFSIIENYGQQKQNLFELYPYIFNPPQYGEVSAPTQGDELRQDFVKEFGNYVILMDLVCKGNLSQYKKVEKWSVEDFFFWANYLSVQKIIENVK